MSLGGEMDVLVEDGGLGVPQGGLHRAVEPGVLLTHRLVGYRPS